MNELVSPLCRQRHVSVKRQQQAAPVRPANVAVAPRPEFSSSPTGDLPETLVLRLTRVEWPPIGWLSGSSESSSSSQLTWLVRLDAAASGSSP
jgi:hypothetical protein